MTVFEADGEIGVDPNSTDVLEESPTPQVAYFERIGSGATLDVRTRGVSTLKIRASSASLDTFDILFATGSAGSLQDGFQSGSAQIDNGVLLKYGTDASVPPTVVGTFKATIAPIAKADLSVALSTNVIQATTNEEFSYAVQTRNIGTEPSFNSTVQLTLPSAFALARIEPEGTDCSGGTTVLCALGTLDPNDDEIVRFVGTANSIAVLNAAATVISQSPETTLSNNTAVVQTKVTERINGDIDTDGDVDNDDLQLILSAIGEPTLGADDRRDMDGDGMITALDARKLVTLCTRARCAIQ